MTEHKESRASELNQFAKSSGFGKKKKMTREIMEAAVGKVQILGEPE